MVDMRSLPLLLLGLAVAGCEKPVPPVYEEPVPLVVPAAEGSQGPRLTVGADGTILLSWMEPLDDGAVLRYSAFDSGSWTPAIDVVEDPAMFVNWADLPAVTALGDDRLFAHWLSYSADLPYAYDVLFARSDDGGRSWSEAALPHSDGTPTEHGFVSLWPADGGVGLVWLDGRKTINDFSDDPRATGMTLRGAFVDGDGNVTGEQEIDGLVCDCCQTDIAVTATGPIAAYRDRTPDEIRDISISRFVDGRWQDGEAFSNDGWEISACPVKGPAIAAAGDLVAVVWFTAASDSPRLYARISTDGGASFGDKILVASAKVKGHADVSYIGESSFAISWVQDEEVLDDIRVRSITTLGALGRIKTVGRSAAMRNVPQMVWSNGDLILAWTDSVGGVSRIGAMRVEIAYPY